MRKNEYIGIIICKSHTLINRQKNLLKKFKINLIRLLNKRNLISIATKKTVDKEKDKYSYFFVRSLTQSLGQNLKN